MRKQLFVETIDALREQFKKDVQFANAINPTIEGEVLSYNNHALSNQIMKILQEEYPPRKATDGTIVCDIEYFCFELDFGSKWKPGMVTENFKEIKLQTAEDLWDYLNYIDRS